MFVDVRGHMLLPQTKENIRVASVEGFMKRTLCAFRQLDERPNARGTQHHMASKTKRTCTASLGLPLLVSPFDSALLELLTSA